MQHLTAGWAARVAMPMQPPSDLEFFFIPGQPFGRGPTVVATSGGEVIGHLTWWLNGKTLYDQEYEVDLVYVVPEWRRKGIGTLLFREARKHQPDLKHSAYRSDMGDSWAKSRSRGRAPIRDFVLPQADADRLGREAHDRIVDEMMLLMPVAASRCDT